VLLLRARARHSCPWRNLGNFLYYSCLVLPSSPPPSLTLRFLCLCLGFSLLFFPLVASSPKSRKPVTTTIASVGSFVVSFPLLSPQSFVLLVPRLFRLSFVSLSLCIFTRLTCKAYDTRYTIPPYRSFLLPFSKLPNPGRAYSFVSFLFLFLALTTTQPLRSNCPPPTCRRHTPAYSFFESSD
jgi:hypothetical protein